MTPPFDPHACIKKLAEAEWPCPLCSPYTAGHNPASSDPGEKCPMCLSIRPGRIVPFTSLRIPCGGHNFSDGRHYHGTLYKGDAEYRLDCPRWIPEPNAEAACWRIHVWARTSGHWDEFAEWVSYFVVVDKLDLTQAYRRAAEAWLDEKTKEVARG